MDSTPLEEIAFLTRSEHRVEVFDRLAERGWTRRELHEATEISQPTLGRMISGFEESGWVAANGVGNGHEYELTPLGALIADSFTGLLDTAATVRKLRDVVPHLPFDEFDFDLMLLKEARITTSDPDDVHAPMRRKDEVAANADHVRTLCSSLSPAAIQAEGDRLLNGEHTGEAIVEASAIDTLTADAELTELLRELLASESVSFYQYDGNVDVMLDLFDETAGIVPLDDDGMPVGAFIETDNDEVRRWVTATVDAYREQSDRVTPEDLPG